jgi:hypothetical protein
MASGSWDPHPGWRNRVDRDLEVLTDQVAALRRVEQLVDAELWRADKQLRWLRMLHRLVCSMDWTTGLVCGVTLAQLAEVGDCSPRTVSRLIAWAQDANLIVVVETGATAAFLGSSVNRAPSYVLVAPPTPPVQHPERCDDAVPSGPISSSVQVIGSVEESGDPPISNVSSKPLTNIKRLNHHLNPDNSWPAWQIPDTPTERSAAVITLLARIGLGPNQVPAWRARALLHQWWTAGACVAGLLYAIDHHLDGTPRGDALRGATDPLRVLGHRLRPWVGHLDSLPAHLTGRHGDYRAAQAEKVARGVAAAEQHRRRTAPGRSVSTASARAAARATLAAVLADRARRRRWFGSSTGKR